MVTNIKGFVRRRARFITLLAIVILLLISAVATVAGASPVEVTVEYSIVIDRPVDEVWAFTSNPNNAVLWIRGLRENKLNPPYIMQEGATGRQVVDMPFGMQNEANYKVTSYVSNESLSYEVTSGLLAGFGVVEAIQPADDSGDASLLTWTLTGTLDDGSQLLEPIYTEMFLNQLQRDFSTLKSVLENEATP
jgi:hypothetical protein